MKEKKKGKVTQHQHASQKGVEVGVKVEGFFLVMLINNIHWYLVMQVNWPFFVKLMDRRYVVMKMNWPFLVTGESQ
jgi:hypothetical protein